MKKAWKFLTGNRVFFLITLPVFLVMVVPKIDAYLRPPVSGFVVETAEMVDGALFLSGWMFKERGRFAGVTVVGKMQNGKELHVPIQFFDNKTDHTANRPKGAQSWGPWRLTVDVPAPDRVVSFSMSASHWLNAFGIKHKATEYGVQTVLVEDYPVPKE